MPPIKQYSNIQGLVQKEIKDAFNQMFEQRQAKLDDTNLFGVGVIPDHSHTGTDSSRLTFIGLSDVPATYTASAGKLVMVNSGATGLTFAPSGLLSGNAGKAIIVSSDASGLAVGGKVGLSGALFDHYTNAGNVTTGETDLYSDTTAANTFLNNGDKIEAEYGGIFVSSGTATREIKIYFGGSAIFDSGALTLSLSSAWTIYVSIIRVSSTVVRYMISMTTEGAALAAYTAVGELTGLTLSSTNIFKITGQAAGIGAATNDIVAKLGHVILISAA